MKIITDLKELNLLLAFASTYEIDDINLKFNTLGKDYIFNLIDQDLSAYKVSGKTVACQLNRLSKYHRIDEDPIYKDLCKNELGLDKKSTTTSSGHKYEKSHWKDGLIASGNMYYRSDYKDTPLKVYSYDINSAYPFAMLKDMPDTRNIKYNQILKPGQIGFSANLTVYTTPGIFCKYVCDLIESPFKDYVDKYYKLKKEAKTIEERNKAKAYLNTATGILAIHNPFLRNTVVYYSNQYIKQFINEDTVYSNIDSIYSLVPRPDIPIGTEIGQFKLEHENEDFIYAGIMQYQIGDVVRKCGSHGLKNLYDKTPTFHYDIIENGKTIQLKKKDE